MTLFLAAALLSLAVVIYVLSPILQDRRAPLDSSADDLTDAQARKRVALMALRDAEYDFATGKLGDEDYQHLRRELSAEALQALRNEEVVERSHGDLSAAAGGGEVAAPESGVGGDPDDAPPEAVSGPAGVEAEVARVRAGLQSGDTCGHCGHVNRRGGKFCTSCGRPLGRRAAAASG
jgi:cytochrome c-type biogenesis protein CcmI